MVQHNDVNSGPSLRTKTTESDEKRTNQKKVADIEKEIRKKNKKGVIYKGISMKKKRAAMEYKNYKKRKSYRYKVKWTTSDFNRYQDQTNYRMNHTEYFGNTKPRFAPFDLDEALRCMYIHQDIEKTSKFRRIFSYFTDVKAFERGQKRSIF